MTAEQVLSLRTPQAPLTNNPQARLLLPSPIMFTVKALYKHETRKFSFDSDSFPTYTQLHEQVSSYSPVVPFPSAYLTFQLARVFPTTHSPVLSRLFFSPHSTTPGTILIAIRVTNAEEYERCTTVYRNKTWPGASLRFVVLEDNTRSPSVSYCPASKRKNDANETGDEPSQKRQNGIFSPMYPYYLPTPPQHTVPTPQQTPVPSPWATLSQRSLPTPTKPIFPVPPPPILFPQVPMDVDPNQSAKVSQESLSTHCCDVDKAKADVRRAAVDFMNNFEGTMVRAFGPNYKNQGATPTSSDPVTTDPTTPRAASNEMGAPTPAEPPIHTGVICDVCESTIRGIRHKCLDCPGTNLLLLSFLLSRFSHS